MLKLLYINSSGIFGGGDRSLYEAISAFPENEVDIKVITPKGDSVTYFSKLGEVLACKGLSQFDNTKYSHYRNIRWLILLREIYYLIPNIIVLWKARKRWSDIDIIHINEITLLFSVFLCKKFFKNVPIVMHVRSVQKDPSAFSSKMVAKFLKKNVETLIAIDQSVAKSLPLNLKHIIIHNGLCIHGKVQKSIINQGQFTLGFVGNFLKSKGIMELLSAFKMCTDRQMDIRLLLVGCRSLKPSFRKYILDFFGINQNYDKIAYDYIEKNNLFPKVELIPFTIDLEKIYHQMDIICFPSCFNACGRPVFEAAFFEKPSIVTITDENTDTIINGVTGICIQDNMPLTIYKAIEKLYENRIMCHDLGVNARKMAQENFDIVKNAGVILNIYRSLK